MYPFALYVHDLNVVICVCVRVHICVYARVCLHACARLHACVCSRIHLYLVDLSLNALIAYTALQRVNKSHAHVTNLTYQCTYHSTPLRSLALDAGYTTLGSLRNTPRP